MALEDLDFKISMDTSDAPGALQALGRVRDGIGEVKSKAIDAQFSVATINSTLTGMAVAAKPLTLVSDRLGVISGTLRFAAVGAHHLSAAIGLVVTFAKYLFAGLSIILSPLMGIVTLAKMAGSTLLFMARVIIAPFKIAIGAVMMLVRGMMILLGPVLAVAEAFFRFKLMLSGLRLQFVLMSKFLSMLPPQFRMIVIGLVALGATGRAGALAMRVFAVGLRGIRIALMVLVSPIAAARMALTSLALTAVSVSMAFVRATVAVTRFAVVAATRAVSAVWSLTKSVAGLAMSLGSKLASAAGTAATAIATVGLAAMAWGGKVAIGLETAETIFGVLLKDMDQGKALMKALNATKVAPFFDSKQIQDAGRDLIKAGVPVTQVTDKLEQLGQMAVATKTPIEDLSRIYRQGMARGSFQTDLVNQMAERGIDIYHALTAATGLTGEALSKAMQDGKIGAVEMNAAIQHMTTGTGIYAGAVEAMGGTTAGMFAQIKNNVGQALAAMMSGGGGQLRGMLASAVAVTEGMKTSFVSLGPVVAQVFGVISDAFNLWVSFASWAWTNVYGQGEATFGNLVSVGMAWATKFRWFFQNFVDIARFAFTSFQLFAVTAFNDIAYFFTDKIPAYLNWFGDNWKQVFTDAGNLIVTVFANIGTNIRNAMTQIWAFIKSGGTAELKFAFTPLLDGFVATVGKLPDIPARAMTELEKSLTAQTEQLGTGLADNFDKMMADASKSLVIESKNVELKDAPDAGGGSLAESLTGDTGSKKAIENKATLVRSSEGQSAISQLLAGFNKDDAAKRTAKAAEQTAEHTEKLARDVDRGRSIGVRAWE